MSVTFPSNKSNHLYIRLHIRKCNKQVKNGLNILHIERYNQGLQSTSLDLGLKHGVHTPWSQTYFRSISYKDNQLDEI